MIALESGGKIGEIVDMCRPLLEAAASGADAGMPQFMAQWVAKAETLIELAAEDGARGRTAFERSTRLGTLNRERVEIPLARGTMPALWSRAPAGGRRPALVYCNGLDSSKELLWWSQLPQAQARRGISTLCVDQTVVDARDHAN